MSEKKCKLFVFRITEEERQRMRQRVVRKKKGRGSYTRKGKKRDILPTTTRRLVA